MGTILSESITVFPSVYRTVNFNGKYTSEHNFINILNSLTDASSSNSDGFVIDYNSNSKMLEIIIHGYYFRIKPVTDDITTKPDLWFGIIVENNNAQKTETGALVNFNNRTTDLDEGNEFSGLIWQTNEITVGTLDSSYSFYQFQARKDNKWNYLKIDSRSIRYSDGVSVTDELNNKQYKLEAGYGITLDDGSSSKRQKISMANKYRLSLDSLAYKGLEETHQTSGKLMYFDKDLIAHDSVATIGATDRPVYLKDGMITAGRKIWASTSSPTDKDGEKGDIWIKYTTS